MILNLERTGEMAEIWKEIEGTNGAYLVSNLGRVKSLNFRMQKGVERVMTGGKDEKGYVTVTIAVLKGRKTQKVHRLVAKAFIPNPKNLPEVNHIDGDKTNNCVDNLEWTNRKGNMSHAARTGAMDNAVAELQKWNNANWKIPVIATDIASGQEKRFESITEAAKSLGVTVSKISACIKGDRKTTGGYKFRKVVNE